MIDALIFDFDGLVLDTEMPLYTSWRAMYAAHGVELPVERWVDVLGRGSSYFDFHGHLEQQAGRTLDRASTAETVRAEARRKIDSAEVRPGVVERLDEAATLAMPIAMASGSSRDWVTGHLGRLGLLDRFNPIVTHEDTERHKPHPEPFALTAEKLGIAAGRCVVFEDSPNGIEAAKAAGMRCVAVPNEITAPLPLDRADLRLESLADATLAEIVERLA
jgi:HAD superfamily hydrolase (TIGR01509 family)